MSLLDDFHSAAAKSKEMTKRPSNEELLDLYARFKQASDGDNKEDRPGGFDFKAIAKHDAWASLKGKTKDQAMTEYIALVARLLVQYS
jgi:acyl-CoA-binding protein